MIKNENIKITVLTSLYNCINYLPTFLEYVAKIDNKDEIEVLLLHNAQIGRAHV